MGYLAGGEDYYSHANDFRNGSVAGQTPFCMGAAVKNNYSSTLFAGEVSRIVRGHDPSVPMFMYNKPQMIISLTKTEFKMCFAIGSRHVWCRGSQPKHVSHPVLRSLIPILLCRYLAFQSVHNPYVHPCPSYPCTRAPASLPPSLPPLHGATIRTSTLAACVKQHGKKTLTEMADGMCEAAWERNPSPKWLAACVKQQHGKETPHRNGWRHV